MLARGEIAYPSISVDCDAGGGDIGDDGALGVFGDDDMEAYYQAPSTAGDKRLSPERLVPRVPLINKQLRSKAIMYVCS